MPTLNGKDPNLFTMWRAARVGGPSYAEREPFKWIGHSLASLPQTTAPGHCVGEADSVTSLEGEPRILNVGGWVVASAIDADLRWVLLADDGDFVVGAGKPGLPSPDVPSRLKAAAIKAPSWPVHHARFEIVAAVDPEKSLFLWGVDSAGNACRVSAVKRG
jgi:hypothetical protein